MSDFDQYSWERVALEEVLMQMTVFSEGAVECSPKEDAKEPEQQQTYTGKSGHSVVSLMDMKPPQYLPNYRNPCWYECLDTRVDYEENVYTRMRRVRVELEQMKRLYLNRVEQGERVRLRCLPYFYITGASHTGTSDLYERVTIHPDVHTPALEQPHWWNHYRYASHPSDSGAINQISNFEDYISLYDRVADHIRSHTKLTGADQIPYHQEITVDASTTTLWDNYYWEVDERDVDRSEPQYLTPHYIHHIQPQAKIVVMLRNPVDRLYAQYQADTAYDEASPQHFHDLVHQQLDAYSGCVESVGWRPCILDAAIRNTTILTIAAGLYHIHLSEWFSVFPRDQFFFIRSEDFSDHIYDFSNMLFEFLGVDEVDYERLKVIEMSTTRAQTADTASKTGDGGATSGGAKLAPPMLESTRQLLTEFYRPHNEQLVQLLDEQRYSWEE